MRMSCPTMGSNATAACSAKSMPHWSCTTMLVALQAQFKGETRDRKNCQLKPRDIDPEWGAQRLVNLSGVWHDQLIEILSAMGMRDVRRLRGDIGRSMMDAELREQSFKGIAWAT